MISTCGSTKPISLLYVDDEPDLLKIGKIFLEKSGNVTVTTAQGPPEAFGLLSRKSYDAIISDYQMPDMDGLSFLKKLRSGGSETPFIIFTGKGREDVVIEALNSGADFYLQKGGNPTAQFAELTHKIRMAVQQRRSEQELRQSRDELQAANEQLSAAEEILREQYNELVETHQELRLKNESLAAAEEELRSQLEEIIDIQGKLFEKNEYLEKLISYANAPIIVWDTRFRITRFNRAFERLTGIPAGEAIGQTLDILFPDDTRDASMEKIRLAMEGEVLDTVEIPVRNRTGDLRYVLWNSATIEAGNGGGLRAIIAQGQDITDRKRAEEVLREQNQRLMNAYEELAASEEEIRQQLDEIVAKEQALRESEARYQTVIEYQTELICRFRPDGTHILVNDAYARYFEREKDEFIGLRFSPTIHPDDSAMVRTFFASLTPDHPVDTVEHRIIMPDGEIRWQQWSDRAIFDLSGTLVEYQSVGRDITDRKCAEEALSVQNQRLMNAYEELAASEEEIRQQLDEIVAKEQALRESEARYQTVIEYQTELICRFRPDGTHILVNDAYARYFEREKDEFIGLRFSPTIHPDDSAMVRTFFASLTPDHPVDTVEHRIIMPDGEIRWQQWSDRAIFDLSGTLVEYQSVGRDITDRKCAEEALQIANYKLKLLSSTTRHDIMNQVMVLQGYLDFAEEMSNNAVQTTYFDGMKKAADSIQLFSEFTRSYENFGVKQPAWLPIHELIARIDDGRLPIRNECGDIQILADPMLEKVFSNLMDNTLRHGEGATGAHLYYRRTDHGLTIIWEDDGTGVPDNHKERIFERGFGKHTGFGLSLTRDILGITGITIHETGKYGTGARFEIHVPHSSYR
jgi:PAS domain S-box-containing protein